MNIEGKTEFSVSSALGYDVYIDKTNYPTEFSALESYLNQFKKEFLFNFYSKKVKKLQKEEKKLQKSFEKQVKKQEKLTKQNEKNNKTIEKLQNKIEKNIKKTEEHKEKEIIFGKDKLKKSEELKDKQSILNSL